MITITDAKTGRSICDATVIARCGDAGAALVAFGPSGNETDATVPGCHYGPGIIPLCDAELRIIATISVSKDGYNAVTVPDVEVRQSTQCPGPDPEPQQVNVALEPDSIGSPAADAGGNATVDGLTSLGAAEVLTPSDLRAALTEAAAQTSGGGGTS